MDVELRHNVAESADVELFNWSFQQGADCPNRPSGHQDFAGQQRHLRYSQILQLVRVAAAGNQHDPWKAGVELKARLAEIEIGQMPGTLLDARVEVEVQNADPAKKPFTTICNAFRRMIKMIGVMSMPPRLGIKRRSGRSIGSVMPSSAVTMR
jgi:hypothetical protein